LQQGCVTGTFFLLIEVRTCFDQRFYSADIVLPDFPQQIILPGKKIGWNA
jgi:hypothetical protein